MRYCADKVKIVIKHKYRKEYCINIKIEDKMLKYISNISKTIIPVMISVCRCLVVSHIQSFNFRNETTLAIKYISSMFSSNTPSLVHQNS